TPTANVMTGLRIDEIFQRTDTTGTRYFLPDALGSTLALTDGNGLIQTQYIYSPFGSTTLSGTTSGNSFEYSSRENDGTGLYFYRARYYHPIMGRFISEDPIRLRGGADFYTYVRNDPTRLIDPTGLIHQAWREPPNDGRLHDDAEGGLEVLCTKGRNIRQDIAWLEHSIFVRSEELAELGKEADAGHINRLEDEIGTLERCQDECEKNKKPEPLPEEIPFWEEWFNLKNLVRGLSVL